MIILAIYLYTSIFAQELKPDSEKSPLQMMLEKDQLVKTKEAPVVINGVTYRKIEAEGKSFYFRFLQKEKPIPIYLCELPVAHKSEQLLEASLKVRNRKRVFFQALVEKCTTRDEMGKQTNNKRTWIEVDPIIGIHIPDGKNDVIKNKRLGIPLKNLTNSGPKGLKFMGEF